MTTASEWAFAIGVALLLYPHVAFPAIAAVRARWRPRPVTTSTAPRPVSVLLAAHAETDVIGARIQNLLDQDYPQELLQIVVACDDGDDGTYAEACRHDTDAVTVLNLPRVGKAAAMNAAIAEARHDIVAFTDANTIWAPDALSRLVAPFADPDVGGTAGDQRYISVGGTDGVGAGEATYWNLDRFLKRTLSAAGSVTSATGAIHALRRELLEPIPPGVTDDFFLSTGAVAAGRRLVFAEDARAFEPLAPSGRDEFARKVRIMTRGLQGVRVRSELLNPRRHGFYALQLLTHKVLRRLAFVPLILMFVASVVGLRTVPWLGWAAAVQGLFYAGALAGLVAPSRGGGRLANALRLPSFLLMTYAAAAQATVRVALGREVHQWGHNRQDPLGIRHEGQPRQGSDEAGDGSAALAIVAPFVLAAAAWSSLEAQPAMAALAAVMGAGVAAVGLLRPALAATAALGLLYSNVPAIVSERVGIPADALGLVVLGLLGLAALRLIVAEGHDIALPPALPWLLLYLGVMVLSTTLTPLTSTAIGGVIGFATEGLLLYILVVNSIRDMRTLRRVLWTIAAVAAILGLLSLVQALTQSYHTDYLGLAQHGVPDGAVSPDGAEPAPKAMGPIGEQNRYAQILVMVVPIPLMLALRHQSRLVRLIASGLALLTVSGVALTGSRGSAVAAILLLVTLALMREVGIRALGAVVLGVALVVTFLPRATDRLVATVDAAMEPNRLDAVDGAVIGRLAANIGAIRVFMDHPIVGVGPRNYPAYHKDAVEDLGLRVVPGRLPHNLYPHIGAELGALGLIAFGAIVIVTLRHLWRVRRRHARTSEAGIFATGLLLAILTYLYSGIFLHLSYQRYFWLLIALGASVAVVADNLETTTEPATNPSRLFAGSGRPSRTIGEP